MKIFHADDEPAFVERVRKLLEPHFEWVGSVGEGSAIVDAVIHLEPDIVLLDISMPGQSGLAAASELREALPRVKLIMVTVHGEDA